MTTSPAELWGSADYERVAALFAPIHDELVERLAIGRGDRVLDVATGTGGVAVRARRRGADVVGVDIAPRMLELARAAARSIVASASTRPRDARRSDGGATATRSSRSAARSTS